ncbi:hypothetical protein GCM10008096_30670 [Zhihengliuella salsuginis]|uniref:Integrase catalytic domain-containing protein n=1 Tax=Zhihengliuella salsuginis TaxID=578222 RepID=A0ABQ3GLQ3_9MICC|nr:hypothetical protein GCM10008096_30670 [Zhihengliuella salsuginis]
MISRATVAKWCRRYAEHGPAGLQESSCRPLASPSQVPPEVVARIEALRRDHKWSATRIAFELDREGIRISPRTVGRWFVRLGINRRRHLLPDGETSRKTSRKITARYPGHMVHLDVKKTGRIPDGGGWFAHGRDSDQARAAERAKAKQGAKRGYVYLHTMVDGFSRLAYTETLPNEQAATTIGFFHRARAFFAAHGITRITRVITDNGSNYTAKNFVRTVLTFASTHQRIRAYTPRHNGKVERYNRILAEEFLYARTWTSEAERAEALKTWNIHFNYHRPNSAAKGRPPASRLRAGVTNVMAPYT